jgi:hypothetical protein
MAFLASSFCGSSLSSPRVAASDKEEEKATDSLDKWEGSNIIDYI